MNLMKHRKIWYAISLAFIIPGVISLILFGLRLSIDFSGGTQIEIEGTKDQKKVIEIAEKSNLEEFTLTGTAKGILIRSKPASEETIKKFNGELNKTQGAKAVSIETIGPSISKEITRNAFYSILMASALIIFYVAYAFRKVPKPANPFEFGFFAVVAIAHDVIIVFGAFSILGKLFNIEVDPLFITAILTIIGFSVHDTIVIFDRSRENLIKGATETFEETVNRSNVETLPRDLTTSFLVWSILLVLFLFGGTSVRYFLLALLIGLASGSYSSILVAPPLMITWESVKERRKLKKAKL
jgi:preprotein translocase subunit SecF